MAAYYWPALQFGGPIPANHGLTKALARRGIDVTVYTTNVGLNGKVPANQEVRFDGVRVFYFSFTGLLEIFAGNGWQCSLPMSRALKKSVKTFDIVHIAGIWSYPTAAAAHYARKYRVPYIIKPMGSLYPFSVRGKGWKKRPYYWLISRRDIQGAAAVHYVSTDEREKCHLAHGLANRAFVSPSGMETPHLPDKQKLKRQYPALQGKKVILFLGRIHRIKGLDVLARAYARLAREREDTHLLIVGPDEGGYETTVRTILRGEGAADGVTFTGVLLGEDKLAALAGSDLFVLPSHSEGFSVAVLEALSCGVPVIISPACHFPEVAETGAGVVVPVDVDRLVVAIRDLLDNPGLRQEMGERGRRLVQEKYTWDSIAGQVAEEYEKILKGTPSDVSSVQQTLG